jgi:hypothetical protein
MWREISEVPDIFTADQVGAVARKKGSRTPPVGKANQGSLAGNLVNEPVERILHT